MVQTCISSRKQHSSRLALMKCCEAVLRESRDLLGTVTQGTGISCHHCCVTLNYSHKVQLIPHWCQAGITQLVWKLWFIHFTKSRADLRGKPGHLDTAALALCHSSVADRVSTLIPAECRLKPVCPVGLSTSGAAWDQHSVLLLQSYKQPFAFGSCTFTMASTGRQKPLHVLITTLITLKQNSEFTRPFSYRKLVLVTSYTVGEASSLSIF